MERNDKINGYDARVNVHKGEFVVKPHIKNSHSMTPKEFETKLKLMQYKDTQRYYKRPLELKNDDKAKYYIIEDGTVFKFYQDTYSFYKLNLDEYKWENDQNLLSIFLDSYLRYQEVPDFEDYFDNAELDLGKGGMKR